MNRSRAFAFVCNNYTGDNEARLARLECVYCIYGYEEAPTTGTPHLQGYFYFKNARSWEAIRLLFPGFDISIARKCAKANQTYCKKDGNFVEYGTCPSGSAPESYEGCVNISQVNFLKWKTCYSIQTRKFPPKVYWFYGKAGTGKTRAAVEMAGGDFFMKNSSKWWDYYEGQEWVIIDDYSPPTNDKDFRSLLQLCDRYEYIIQYKGGSCYFNSNIIITCEFPPDKIWHGNMLRQICRRLLEIRHFVSPIRQDGEQISWPVYSEATYSCLEEPYASGEDGGKSGTQDQ